MMKMVLDIFQMSYADIEIVEGSRFLRSIKLSPKGLTRWYTDCCRTPIGNTVNGKTPFIGVIHSFMDIAGERAVNLGPIKARTLIKKNTATSYRNTPMYKIVPRIVTKLLFWKLRDSKKPNPFFNADGSPVSKPEVLSL